jgi:glycosyltransferase involved in cell wall biosynthesis
LGRWSEQKDYPVMLRGVAGARARGVDVRLRIEGPGVRTGLAPLVAELGLGEVVILGDGVPPADVPGLLDAATALVNTTRAGATDKAVFEAMACGRPALASSPTFRDLLDGLPVELRFSGENPDALADAIAGVAAAGEATLRQTGDLARERVVVHHSVEHWAGEVLNLAEFLTRRGSASRAALR